MESSLVYVVIAVLVVLIAVGAVVGLMRRGRAGARPAPPAPARTTDVTATAPAPASTAVPAPEAVAAPPSAVEEVATPGDLEAVLEVEVPEPATGRMHRLRARLARSNTAIGRSLLTLLSRDTVDASTWDEIEETLLLADLGVGPTTELVEALRTRLRVEGASSPEQVRGILRDCLLDLVGRDLDRSLATSVAGRPAVLLVVGVNGTGKTTTTGKIARLLIAEGGTVVLGAADTFRAAAADQLQTWGDRVGAAVVRGPEGSDPASVAFEAVSIGIQADVDTVVVDTAGRLHTKTGLMDELGKVKRVIEKQSPVDEVLLVLDATTGQNGLAQARVFAEVVDVTGIVLTKLDGTAKGGIVVSVQRELGVPVKLVGLGEGPDDLAPFEPVAFVDALLDPVA